jgi:hypothetical protein
MTYSVFYSFYEKIVLPTAINIVERNQKLLLKDKKNNTPLLQFDDSDARIRALYLDYITRKNMVISVTKGGFIDKDNNPETIDHHKIAACLTDAISRAGIIYCSGLDEQKGDLLRPGDERVPRANEELAFRCAIRFLCVCIIQNAPSEDKKKEIVKILEEKGFYYPDTIASNGIYLDSIVRGLFFSGISFGRNPLLLANIFFLLELNFYNHYGITPPKLV